MTEEFTKKIEKTEKPMDKIGDPMDKIIESWRKQNVDFVIPEEGTNDYTLFLSNITSFIEEQKKPFTTITFLETNILVSQFLLKLKQ